MIKTAIISFFLLFTKIEFAQCAMCRAALASSSDKQIAEGVNNGITYLMAIPYILVVLIGFWFWKKQQKNITNV